MYNANNELYLFPSAFKKSVIQKILELVKNN
ncbi:hypothetical protein LCGC14_0815780 [marine sediment metagenome]|uniref:Uncharacterized protein n=1 Tax=marine sediment metagenome TaxID=412755 RepID=A0A0F9SSS3_9ZZZZ